MKQRTRRPKPRPKKISPLVVVGGNANLPRWGTQKQAKLNERDRGYKNRIHELETEIAGAGTVIDNLVQARDRLMRVLDTALSPKNIAALRKVCLLPLSTSIQIGIDEPLGILCVWLTALENSDKGTIAAALVRAGHDKLKLDTGKFKSVDGPNPNPVFPSQSGIVSNRPDPDNNSVDDLYAKCVDVHLERMGKNDYWLGLTPITGETVHIDITQRKSQPLRARVRK